MLPVGVDTKTLKLVSRVILPITEDYGEEYIVNKNFELDHVIVLLSTDRDLIKSMVV